MNAQALLLSSYSARLLQHILSNIFVAASYRYVLASYNYTDGPIMIMEVYLRRFILDARNREFDSV